MAKDIQRKIAVIFVTDVVGFSKMMEKNEDETLRSFRSCRDILDNLFKEHDGRIFNTAGDSVLAEFQSAVSAVVCAKEFQKLIKERNENVSHDASMMFRIGLNMGDVIVEGENLYGEGVNVAARLEALSQPNGVCLSKSILDFVNKKTEFDFHDLGEQKVKNTFVHAYDLADPDLEIRKLEKQIQKEDEDSKPPTIAVLPFNNMSNDPEQDYFADGITEDIISHLSKWKTFPVISSNSIFSYKNTKETTKKIAGELNAKYLIVGSVRKGGNKVRINTQLIDADKDTQIWSQNWDRSLEDIFEIQDEVSQKVAVIISPALKANEIQRLDVKKKVNLSAWDENLQAQSYLSQANYTQGLDLKSKLDLCLKAIEHAEKAISLDGNLAEAHIVLSQGLMEMVFEPSLDSERKENQEKFFKHTEKAYSLDPENPDAIMAKGIQNYLTQDIERFMELIQKAIDVNPNHPRSLQMYSMSLMRQSKFDEAIDCVKKAIEIDPVGRMEWESWLIFCYISKKDLDNALNSINRTMQDAPHNRLFGFKAAVLALKGEIDESKEWLQKYLTERPEIKTIADYRKVAPEMSESLINNLVEGMKLAGLPE
ncbi:MAG: adenylate/guanylate cyclase domain-containing protein [SAR116 cluster bacterium]|nr:adenylate/guanylate cyclase domain-containing protein [SAR116 cluster bacterium]